MMPKDSQTLIPLKLHLRRRISFSLTSITSVINQKANLMMEIKAQPCLKLSEVRCAQHMAIQRNCASHFVQIGSQCKYFNPGENNLDQSDFRCLNLGKVRLLSLPLLFSCYFTNKGKRKFRKNLKLLSTPFVVRLPYPIANGSDIHSTCMSVGRTWLYLLLPLGKKISAKLLIKFKQPISVSFMHLAIFSKSPRAQGKHAHDEEAKPSVTNLAASSPYSVWPWAPSIYNDQTYHYFCLTHDVHHTRTYIDQTLFNTGIYNTLFWHTTTFVLPTIRLGHIDQTFLYYWDVQYIDQTHHTFCLYHLILSQTMRLRKDENCCNYTQFKTSQELRMLSRSLSDCKVTVSNSQLVKKSLLIEI